MRLPSVSRIHFIECGANTAMEWGNVGGADGAVHARDAVVLRVHRRPAVDPARPVRRRPGRRLVIVLAEGADGSGMTRTIAMERSARRRASSPGAMNGEMLRPENGYPLRLVVPGVQGVSWVKYLRRARGGRPAVGHARTRSSALRRPDARRTSSPVHVDPGMQVGHHDAVGRPDAARQAATTTSPGSRGRAAARSGASTSRRRRPQLAHRAARRAGAVEGADPLQHRLDLGRRAGGRCSRARSTRPATCNRRSTSCARCAARARSITTTRSSRGGSPRTARSQRAGSERHGRALAPSDRVPHGQRVDRRGSRGRRWRRRGARRRGRRRAGDGVRTDAPAAGEAPGDQRTAGGPGSFADGRQEVLAAHGAGSAARQRPPRCCLGHRRAGDFDGLPPG